MRNQSSHSDGIIARTTRYDAILGLVPISLFLGVVTGTFTDLPLTFTVGVSGLISAAALAFGMFVAPPTTPMVETGNASELATAAEPYSREETGRNRRRSV